MNTIKIDTEYIELFKLIKLLGLAETGGMAKALVDSGQVSVDGVAETRKRCKIRSGQVVRVRDAEITVS